MVQQTKVCGILGGLGPSASVDLYREITALTPATSDQEHLHVIVNSNPRIPDRTNAILNGTTEPVPGLVMSAQTLEKAGADFIVIPCNTAHYFLPDIQAGVDIPILDMIKITAQELNTRGFKRVGLISTSATAKMKLYDNALQEHGIDLILTSETGIDKQMEVIYGPKGVKAGMQYEGSEHNIQLLTAVIDELVSLGAQAIILGCTEIPLTFFGKDMNVPIINPTKILAQAAITEAIS